MVRRADLGANAAANLGSPGAGQLEPVDALSLVARSGLLFFQWLRDRGLTYVSENGRELLGWGNRELAGGTDYGRRVLAPESSATLDALADELFESGRPNARAEVRLRAADGHDVWLDASLLPLASPLGEVRGFSGVAFDSTEAIEARRAAQDAEDRYRRIFEHAPVPLWISDPETDRILDSNGMACGLYGWNPGQMEGRTVRQITHPDEWQRVEAALRGGRPEERVVVVARTRQMRKDGHAFVAEVAMGMIRLGRRKVRLAMVRDLSASDEARESVAAKRRAIAGASEPMMILDRQGRVTFANAACERLIDHESEALVGQDPAGLAAAPGWAGEWRRALAVVQLGEPWSGWMAFRGAGGGELEGPVEMESVQGEDGTVAHVVVRLRPSTASLEGPGGEAELFLQLLRVQVEDLVKRARGQLEADDPAGPFRAEQFLIDAEDRMRLLGDLSLSRGPAGILEGGVKPREVNAVVEESVACARSLLAPGALDLTRSSRASGLIGHAALVREALAQLLVDAHASMGDNPGRLVLKVEADERDGRAGACITVEGPRARGLLDGEKRARLGRAAFDWAGGRLEENLGEEQAGLVRFRARLPFAPIEEE